MQTLTASSHRTVTRGNQAYLISEAVMVDIQMSFITMDDRKWGRRVMLRSLKCQLLDVKAMYKIFKHVPSPSSVQSWHVWSSPSGTTTHLSVTE